MTYRTGSALHEAILAAHDSGSTDELADLYLEAAIRSRDGRREDESAFFLTQAYVFALESGAPVRHEIASRLRAAGRL